ncbi:MAG: thioredoxin family protein [Bacteroidia bacterium]|nr:thioredoxin family protein [Bacteroidia bacterium]MDW8236343.1 thioredoxin family protein [Bacteroidia bacterium]
MRYLLLGWMVGLSYAQGLEKSIPQAFARAKQERKLLWVMVSATWCKPCKVVEKKVLSNPEFFKKVANDYVLLKVYASSGEQTTPGAEEIVQRYKVKAYPTFLYLSPEGELLHQDEGVSTRVYKGSSSQAVEYFVEEMAKVKKRYK